MQQVINWNALHIDIDSAIFRSYKQFYVLTCIQCATNFNRNCISSEDFEKTGFRVWWGDSSKKKSKSILWSIDWQPIEYKEGEHLWISEKGSKDYSLLQLFSYRIQTTNMSVSFPNISNNNNLINFSYKLDLSDKFPFKCIKSCNLMRVAKKWFYH